MYVDDALFGADSIKEAVSLAKDFTELLMAGGFPLRKWFANYPDLLTHVPSEWHSNNSIDSQVLPKEHKLLDLMWKTSSDDLTFSFHSESYDDKLTKRAVLSLIAKCYDPLGLLSQVIIS